MNVLFVRNNNLFNQSANSF